MKVKIFNIWYYLQSSFWFVPAIMVISAVILSYIMNLIEISIGDITGLWWVYSGSIEGARSILSSIATSTITVAGTIFSITIAVLSFSSRQFGSRIIRRFISDRGNQIVLGTFLATFIYCLLTLGTLQGGDGSIPQASVMAAFILAIASIGVLVYFIHHIAVSIQSNSVIASVAGELRQTLHRVFPGIINERSQGRLELKEEPAILPEFKRESYCLLARNNGYIQEIDLESLLKIAVNNNLILMLQYRAGDFVNKGSEIAKVYPGKCPGDKVVNAILKSFIQGNEQTPEQDVGYSFDRLVQVAVSALSPSYNDPFTAITCIHWIGVNLIDLAGRKIPSPNHFDRNKQIRVIEKPLYYARFVKIAFDKFQHAAGEHTDVLVCLLDTLALIAGRVIRTEDYAPLFEQLNQLYEAAHLRLKGSNLQRVVKHYQIAVKAFQIP